MAVEKTFIKACMDYFGKKEGQTLQGFAEELRALTPEDKAELAAEFAKVGITIVEKAS